MIKRFTKKHYVYIILLCLWVLFYVLIRGYDAQKNILHFSELDLYERLGREFLSGQIPFIDAQFEYPPGSVLPFAIPALFSSNTESYRTISEVINLGLSFATGIIGAQILGLFNKFQKNAFLIFYSNAFLLLTQIFLDRFDVYPMFLTALGVYLYLQGEKNNKTLLKSLSMIGFVWGGLIKLYPFFLMPIFFIFEYRKKQYKTLLYMLFAIIITLIPFIPIAIFGFDGIKNFWDYHSTRGLELESTYSSVLLLFGNVVITYSHSSFGISGQCTNLAANVSTPLFLISYVLVLATIFKRYRKVQQYDMTLLGVLVVILLFIVTNKVFSTQFFLWLFPFLFMIPFLVKSSLGSKLIFTSLVATFLTIVIFPNGWEALKEKNSLVVYILLVRNILVIGLFLFYMKVIMVQNKKRYLLPHEK